MRTRHERKKHAIKAWFEAVDRQAKSAARTFKPPGYFGSPARTKIILALAINGIGRRIDLVLAGCFTGYLSLGPVGNDLAATGIIQIHRLGRVGTYYRLNPKHPAYRSIRRLARVVDAKQRIPRWGPYRLKHPPQPQNTASLAALGEQASCRVLVFLEAAGVTYQAEIADMLGIRPHGVEYALGSLERRGVIVIERRKGTRAARINPKLLGYEEYRAVLRAFLRVHTDLRGLAKRMRSHRKRRRKIEE